MQKNLCIHLNTILTKLFMKKIITIVLIIPHNLNFVICKKKLMPHNMNFPS